MNLISIFDGDNIGSIAQIEIAHYADFKSWNPLDFYPEKGWKTIEITGEIAELKRKTKNDPNGKVYTYSGFFDIQSIRDEVELNLMPFVGRKSVLKITDNNGRIYVIGQPNNPVLIEEESSTGKLYKNKNGYLFSFSVVQACSALHQC